MTKSFNEDSNDDEGYSAKESEVSKNTDGVEISESHIEDASETNNETETITEIETDQNN